MNSAGFHETAAARSEPHVKIQRAIKEMAAEVNLDSLRVELEPAVLRANQRAEAEGPGNLYNAGIIIWGEDTGVQVRVNFLNLKQPEFYAGEVTINEVERVQGPTRPPMPGLWSKSCRNSSPFCRSSSWPNLLSFPANRAGQGYPSTGHSEPGPGEPVAGSGRSLFRFGLAVTGAAQRRGAAHLRRFYQAIEWPISNGGWRSIRRELIMRRRRSCWKSSTVKLRPPRSLRAGPAAS